MRKNLPFLFFYFLLFAFFFQNSLFAQVVRPNNLSSLVLWLRADSLVSGPSISNWPDCSLSGYNIQQPTLSSQPTLLAPSAAINNHPSVYFDGNDFLTGGDILDLGNNDMTIICLIKNNSGPNPTFIAKSNYSGTPGHFALSSLGGVGFGLFYGNSAGSQYAYSTPPPDGSFFLCSVTLNRSAGLIDIRINGSNFTTHPFTPETTFWDNSLDFCIGSISSGAFNLTGEIPEIAIFNTSLSPGNVTGIEQYYINKYFPPVNLGPDINVSNSFCSTTLNAGVGFSSYSWSTGATSQSINVNPPGGKFWVDVVNSAGFHSSDTILVTYPIVNLTDTSFICSGDSVLLSTGLGGGFTYQWSSGKTTPSIYVKTSGKYWVTVTDASLCPMISDTATVIKDSFALVASLGNDTTLCSGNSIALHSPNPLPAGLTYLWSPGGATSPSIIIPAGGSGTYAVTVTDIHGCAATDNINVTVTGTAPSADFNFVSACIGQSVQFTDNSSTPNNSWLWNFSDGNTSTTENPSHAFSTGGTFNVAFEVGYNGCKNTITKPVYVPSPPQAAFSADTACAGYDYTFSDQSNPVEGTIISWFWDFGDGSHSHAQDTLHSYLAAGNYNVTLTVQTSSGCQNAVTHSVVVVNNSIPPTQFYLDNPLNGSVIPPGIINFSWNPSLNAVTYKLQIADDSLFTVNVISINGSATSTSANLSLNQKYFWRVIAYNRCGDAFSSEIRSLNVFTPSAYASQVLWLMADQNVVSSGGTVSDWKDNSNSALHALQANQTNQPAIINSIPVLNNNSTLAFNGNNWLSLGDNLDLSGNDFTYFIVFGKPNTNDFTLFSKSNYSGTASEYSITDIGGDFGMYYKNNSGGQNAIINNPVFSPFNIACVKFNRSAGKTKLYINDVLKAPLNYLPESTSWNNTIDFTIGSSASGVFKLNGNISEIIIYSTALSDADRGLITSYLRFKYAPPVNLGPDIWANNFCDTTLEASQRFIHYKWNTGNIADTLHNLTVNTGGTYSVTATDVFGFISVDTVIVHKPVVNTHSDTLCHGDSTTLHSGTYSPFITSWTHSGNTTVAESYVVHAGDTVMLHVSDTSGCSLNRQIIMHADNFPIANLFAGSTMNACTGDIIFLDTAAVDTSTITSYDWLADGNHYNTPAFTIPPTWTSGSHALSLTITNARGCIATDNVIVWIAGAQPNVSFIFNPVCNYGGVANTSFDDQSTANTGVLTSWHWDFGDNTSLTFNNSNLFFHPYTDAAYYPVTLTVTTNQNCHKTITQQVPVYSVPAPAFQPHLGCQGALVHIHDHSTSVVGDITSWDWTFIDPSNPQVSSDTNPVHVFNNLGIDSIKLVVTTEFGCKDSIKESIQIRYAPHVGFTYTNVCDGNPVYFTDTTQTQVWAPVNTWLWNFGNSQTSITDNPVYTFDSAGTYNVSLTVHSINGCTATDTEQVVVHAIPSAALALPEYCAQTLYTLHDSSSILAPDSITSWLWDFGTLGTSGDSTPVLTFSNPGVFPVILTVKSNAGCQDMVKDSIHVYPVPTAAFLPSVYYCTAPCTILFTSSSTGSLNYQWTFGDTASLGSIEQDPSHMYSYNDSTGFDVVLINTNNYGCSDTAHQLVFVTPTTGDIKVSDVKAVKQNGFVTLSAHITNLGTRSVYSIDVYAKTAGGTAYKETMDLLTNPLKPGEDTLYTFTGQYQLSDQQVTEYICVEAQITNYVPDDDPTNNEQCLTFTTQFIAFEPYPSPVNDHVNIDFILPFEDNVVIELYGMKGDKVKDIYSGVAQKGLNQFTVDVSDLALAVYSYRIIYRNDQKILKFVKY